MADTRTMDHVSPRLLRPARCFPATLIFLLALQAHAAPSVKQIGPGLYAYISDNDSSANSTFLVGTRGILVVDTGLNEKEGGKLLHAIKDVSSLPVNYIVNTHYHPDHQGGNTALNPAAVVISTEFTRRRTMQLMGSPPASEHSRFRPAELTFGQKFTVHLEPY